MRGIPKKVATREDVYNLARDLPVDEAVAWLNTLGRDELKRLKINQEEFWILKSSVAHDQYRDRAIRDKRLAVELALVNAVNRANELRAAMEDAQAQILTISRALNEADAEVARLKQGGA